MHRSFLLRVLFAASGGFMALAVSPSWSQVNVLQNGSFEQLANVGIPDAWTRSYVSSGGSSLQSSSVVKCGDYSLKVIDGSSTQAEGVISDAINIIPGATYTAEAYIQRTAVSNGASIYIKYYDAGLVQVGSFSVGASGSLNVWNYASITGRAPIDAQFAKVICYSNSTSTGTIYFDGVSFRASGQNLVANPDMSLDAIGSGYPVNWSMWSGSSQPVTVAQDPLDPANLVMKLADSSATQSANARTRIPVIGNMTYTVSADIYYASGSTPALYLKYYDENGAEIDSASVASSSLGTWATRSITRRAPESAVECQVLAYISSAATGIAYFDNFSVTTNPLNKYVAPAALGLGDGSSAANAAKYNNATFWSGINTQLATQSVKVTFAEGDYVINTTADRLYLSNVGTATNALIMEGARPYGSVFTKNEGAATGMTGNAVTINWAKNVVLRHLHWEDDTTTAAKQTAYSLVVNSDAAGTGETRNIIVEGCSFVGLDQNYYGAMGVHYKTTHRVTTRLCEFVRVGVDGHTHMIYHSYGPYDLRVLNNYFQDCTGAYVRFRAGSHAGVVESCAFVSTNATCNRHFIEQAVFNDVNPGDETLGNGFTYSGNTFSYLVASGNDRVAIQFTANGYNPVDENNVAWPYLLTASEGSTLRTGTISAKKALIKTHFDLDFGVDTTIEGNTRTGSHLYKLRLESFANYGAINLGGDGEYDVSNLGAD